jgi:MFS transporter, putative metabolite:H+ symporter
LMLLLMRAGAYESGMYQSLHKTNNAPKGAFFSLFTHKKRFYKYINCIFIGLPIWFVVGVLINFSNQFYADTFKGIEKQQLVADAIMFTYLGLSFGDLLSGLLSQFFRSRKKIVLGYILAIVVLVVVYLLQFDISYTQYNLLCFLLGSATGYWALFVTIAAEQFGTNLRSTVTSTVPNFVRGAVVPITISFGWLRDFDSPVTAAIAVGGVCLALAIFATIAVPETFSKDLDYLENDQDYLETL